MNILPKKRWHVRTKENVARVRRDEAKAAEEENRKLERAIEAQNERRLGALRAERDKRQAETAGFESGAADLPTEGAQEDDGRVRHINLFADLEREERKNLTSGNTEYAQEKEAEKQEHEKKLGILKYLGEGTNELTGQKSWYDVAPERPWQSKQKPSTSAPVVQPKPEVVTSKPAEVDKKEKTKKRRRDESSSSSDERGKKSKKSKKSSKKHKSKSSKKSRHRSSSSSEDESAKAAEKQRKLQQLRDERLRRERMEASRVRALLNPELVAREKPPSPKYNSMFNPEFARNNHRR